MTDLDLCYMTASDALQRYRDGSLSPLEATKAQLDRLDAVEPKINAFMTRDHETALSEAKASQERWAAGSPAGPLDGITVTIKDLIPMKDRPLRNGTATSDDTPCDVDAPTVARLREAGCVFLGKTTSPEYGWKGITDGPLFGFTRNPWNLAHSPGGSSGGAAASLAAGIGHLALGNDGGGSVRIPCSYSGLYGLKPTFGRVPNHPREGPFCMTSTEGPMTRSVADAALMLNTLALPDAQDWYALPHDDRDWRDTMGGGVADLKIAYAPGLGGAVVDDEVRALTDTAAQVFAELGAVVDDPGPIFEPLEGPMTPHWLAGFAAILRSIPTDKHDLLDPRFRAVASRGLSVTTEELLASIVHRDRLGTRLNQFHQEWDLLLMPTLPTAAPLVDTPYHSQGLHRWDHATPFTVPFNLTGQPGASIPCGLTRGGLPVGLQIVAAKYREDLILRASQAYEDAMPPSWPNDRVEAALGETVPPAAERYGEPVAE
ncbi:MAG: amidase [Rhodospirillaceae bacterium]|nr:amidase [Rhodospirillaceae bacterium]